MTSNPRLDAIALVRALRRDDREGFHQVADKMEDPRAVLVVLARMTSYLLNRAYGDVHAERTLTAFVHQVGAR